MPRCQQIRGFEFNFYINCKKAAVEAKITCQIDHKCKGYETRRHNPNRFHLLAQRAESRGADFPQNEKCCEKQAEYRLRTADDNRRHSCFRGGVLAFFSMPADNRNDFTPSKQDKGSIFND